MRTIDPLNKGYQKFYVLGCVALLILAAFRCYTAAAGINWFSDTDFYRDMSCVRQNLHGAFGQDPAYLHEYLWYNPLLPAVETLAAKITAQPLNLLYANAGVWINMLAPITFTWMMVTLFDWRVAMAGLLSFLFLSSGDLMGWDAATYSPWLYPGIFTQSLFYIDVIVCYKAFVNGKYSWFALLGAMLGVTFLSHTAPTLLMITIIIVLQLRNLGAALRRKDYTSIRRYIVQGVITFSLFIAFAMPLLYFVVGKYHLRFLNREPSELVEGLFIFRSIPQLLKMNLSIALLIAAFGVVWAASNLRHPVIRKILFAWPVLTILLFIYSTAASSLDRNHNIHLPVTVPSFHYFFYLKAAQSVFFGLGLVFLIQIAFRKWSNLVNPGLRESIVMIICLAFGIGYYPVYHNRQDFTYNREKNLEQDKYVDRIKTYHYILDSIPQEKVILCEENTELFPMMPTARKMVCIGRPYSNPYVDFWERHNARDTMLSALKSGRPLNAKDLFDKYEVNYVLLSNANFGTPQVAGLDIRLEYKTDSFSIYRIIK
jgi:uncharacterized membrane protein